MTKEELRNALLKKDNKFTTDYIVVANTYMNISFELLTQKLNLLIFFLMTKMVLSPPPTTVNRFASQNKML